MQQQVVPQKIYLEIRKAHFLAVHPYRQLQMDLTAVLDHYLVKILHLYSEEETHLKVILGA